MARALKSRLAGGWRIIRDRLVPATLVAALVLGVWETACRLSGAPRFLAPRPSDIWQSLAAQRQVFGAALGLTALEALAALIVSAVVGVAAATVFAASRRAERLAVPYIVILQATPIVATAPLILIWFGPDFHSIVAIAALMTVFPIFSNMLTGLKATDPALLDLHRLNSATAWQTFWRLRLPAAIPYLGVGLRIASPLAVVGVIVGEYVAGLGSGGAGLGFLITQSALRLDTPSVFAAGLTASAVGIAFWKTVDLAIQAFLKSWHASERDS
jgi:NitT/TauT family transport system permease protein